MIQYIHLNLKAFQSGVFYLSDNYLKTYVRSEWYSYLQLPTLSKSYKHELIKQVMSSSFLNANI